MPTLNSQIKKMVKSWGKYRNPKELEKDVKVLLDNVVKTVRNKFEFTLHDQFKRSKLQFGYEAAKLQYVLRGVYTPDWVVYKDKQRTKVKFVVEAKGYFRREQKRIMAACKKQHPKLDMRIVFYRYRKADIKWAEKHGFKYAIGRVPKDWLK